MFPLGDRNAESVISISQIRKPKLLLGPGLRRLIKSGTMKPATGSTRFERQDDGESAGKYRIIIYRPAGEGCLVFTQPAAAVAVKAIISKPALHIHVVPNAEENDSNVITSVSGMGICGLHF